MKNKLLNNLNDSYQSKINEHYKSDVKLVYGSGSAEARFLLIGEAPGKNEVIQGKPFVGQAGKNLDEFIEVLNIRREDIYITNIVKLRPTKTNPDTGRESNRPPTKEEIVLFTDYIKEELSIIQPELVVTLGNVALKCLLGDNNASIGELHGGSIHISLGSVDFNLFPLYHPASIIYRQELKKVYLEDLYKLREYIEVKKII